RPLKRALQRRILDPLAQRMLQGEFRAGETVKVDARDGDLVFLHEAPSAHADD
ncbi:MAG TPA: hypothetical protein VIJ28_19955, partial [Chloroflexota bacterium]